MALKWIPPLWWLLSMLLSYGLVRLVPAWSVLPSSGMIVGLLVVAGLALALAGVLAFRRAGTTANPRQPQLASRLVVEGVYRYSRNPMYMGLALLLCAWAVYWGHVLAWLGVVVFVVCITRYQIRPEEAALLAKFGQPYQDYCAQTRRWL